MPDELWDPEKIQKRKIFTQCVEEKCGEEAKASDFEFNEEIVTPTYEAYEDDVDDHI